MEKIQFETPLCEIAYKYGTDKCPQIGHVYTPFYYELLKDKRQSIKKVLEVGIGSKRRGMKGISQYVTGASLRMWRDFFPSAQVYGVDIFPELMFKDERITTFLCDEKDKKGLEKLISEIGSDIDLVVDDASHYSCNQIFLCQTLMPLLKKDVIYVIEDVAFSRSITKSLNQYECEVPYLVGRRLDVKNSNKLMIVKNK